MLWVGVARDEGERKRRVVVVVVSSHTHTRTRTFAPLLLSRETLTIRSIDAT